MESFDIDKYSYCLERFLMALEDIQSEKDIPELTESMEIFKMLGISRIEIYYYDSEYAKKKNKYTYIDFFDSGSWSSEESLVVEKKTNNENYVTYKVYQYKDDEPWDDVIKAKVNFVVEMLFSFKGRIRVMNTLKKVSYYSQEMNMYNTSYLLRKLDEYLNVDIISKYVAVFMNIKGLSSINRMYGRKAGTEIVKRYIALFSEIFADDELACHVGGDNFALLFRKEKLDAVLDIMNGKTVDYDNELIKMSVTAGVYIIPENCKMLDEIMENITSAYNVAKNVNHENISFYNEDVVSNLKHEKNVEMQFENAIENEEFMVVYQPKVRLKGYNLAGAEALCRWQHDGKIYKPDSFVPILEQSNAICTLDFYMLEHVCRDIRKWLDEGRRIVKISINLSRKHLYHEGLVNKLLDIIDSYRVPHEYIEFEVTETTTDVDFKVLKDIISNLQRFGISTSVDDFGIGYSSLNLIRELPWNVLKIDKSFLSVSDGLDGTDKVNKLMLKRIIGLAHELGLESIVEGVETAEQVMQVKTSGCYMAQGFYFDKPLERSEFESRLDYLMQ